jgi:hypothetical protein
MTARVQMPWEENGARAATRADHVGRFIDQHILPLFFRRTATGAKVRESKIIVSEKQFWSESNSVLVGAVRLEGFRLTDWFPRAPGVYWSEHARQARAYVGFGRTYTDAELGNYYSPQSKMGLIEEGGIGTIRLRPRQIDGEDCWLATALTEIECHAGIPLAIPDTLLRHSNVTWGDRVEILGRVRFLQDAGLDDTASRVHHARPLIVFVDELRGLTTPRSREPIVITPVALFESGEEQSRYDYNRTQYAFVHCAAGSDLELDAAGEWIEKYAIKFDGRVITNFDEQRPNLADAPLSYQRLVAKTYERTIIEHFHGTIHADRIDSVVQESTTTQNYGDVHMGHEISVGGSAIINIDSTLSNVTQTIGAASGLDAAQKSNLDAMVQSLKTDLDRLKANYPDEANEIAGALEKAVTNAVRPPRERKRSLLQLSAKGLKEAAELLGEAAPSIIATAGLIAKFIVGLP